MMNNRFQKVLAVALMTGFLSTSISMGISEAAPAPHRMPGPGPAHHQQVRPSVHKVGPVHHAPAHQGPATHAHGPVHHAPAMHRQPAPPPRQHGPVVVRHRPTPQYYHNNHSKTMHGKDWARVAVAGGIIAAVLANS